MNNGVFPLTLQKVYHDFDLVASTADAGVSLHERLEHRDEHLLTAFTIVEKSDAIGVYDWRWRVGHRSMKTIVDMAMAWTRMVLGTYLKT